MLGKFNLPIWPTTLDCISWSKDNQIAIAGGEYVAVLTPRLKVIEHNDDHWDTTLIRANAFTATEVPLSDPLSFEKFSVGEELSQRYVHALAWSSPGLAKSSRCVLAVLSSNHVLSIWECVGKPEIATSWKRSAIVNHAVLEHYNARVQKRDGETARERLERRQKMQRIRAFAWSPPVYKEWASEGNEDKPFLPYVDYGHQFLAVSTEAEEILFLRVTSPHSKLETGVDGWKIEVVGDFNSGLSALDGLYQSISDKESYIHPCNDDYFIADYLAWGNWAWAGEDGFGEHATLAFVSNGRLFCQTVEGDVYMTRPETRKARPPKGEGRQYIPSRSDIMGPLRFIPRTSFLVCFAADCVFCVDTSINPTEPNSHTSHHLDGRWDEASGVAVSGGGNKPLRIHITSHLSSATATTTALPLPLVSDATSKPSLWQYALNESKAQYSVDYDLGRQVQERTWGIAESPLGTHVATAASMHPSDAIAYVTHAEQETIISINLQDDTDEVLPFDGGTSHPADVTAEIIFFRLKGYLESHPESTDSDVLAEAMMQSLNPPRDHFYLKNDMALIGGGGDIVVIYRHLKLQLFMRRELMSQRLKLLTDIALNRTSNVNQIARMVVSRLVTETLRLPAENLQGGALSGLILNLHRIVKSRLLPRNDPQQEYVPPGNCGEKCGICEQAILFESTKWARCESGHQFLRCGLTFLCIQEPGMTKRCTICNTQFLNELMLSCFQPASFGVKIPELPLETQESDGPEKGRETAAASETGRGQSPTSYTTAKEPPGSLARTLFAAFNMCIYCGGHFNT